MNKNSRLCFIQSAVFDFHLWIILLNEFYMNFSIFSPNYFTSLL